MINLKFLKTQVKSSLWITIGIAVVPVIISILCMSFTPYFWNTTIKEGNTTSGYMGGVELLGLTTFFGPVGEILAIAFATALAIKLINAEISKGYMSSWLSLPMSRTTVFLTKTLTIFLLSLVVVLPGLLVQFIISEILYSDFGGFEAWTLIKLNLGLMIVFFFTAAVAIIASTFFNKTSYAITLSIIVPLIFIVLFIMSSFMSQLNGMSFLQYFKYITFFSLYDYKQIIDGDNLHFIWKFILLFIIGFSIFIASGYLFKNKNLYI